MYQSEIFQETCDFHKLGLLDRPELIQELVGDFRSSLKLSMMNANFHFGTVRYPCVYTILFTFVAHYLNNK